MTMDQEPPLAWVQAYGKNIQSQHGEDGIIDELFKRIGNANKWCVEFGALNGTHHSNSWHAVMEEGYSGVLIEADPTYFEKLQQVYKDTPRAYCMNEFVEFEGSKRLDALLARTPIPKDFDLLSIDIDGNDYHVWDSLTEYRPRAVLIEFNPTIPNDISFVQPRDMSVQQGSSLLALQELGKAKGYRLAAVVGVNGFFVLEELFSKLGLAPATLDEMYPDTMYHTRLFQLYDGTLVLDGYQELLWRHQPLRQEDVQALPAHKRKYLSGVSSGGFMRTFKYYARKFPLYSAVQRVRKNMK